MNPDDFEKRLQRAPLREIPPEWRKDILRQAVSSPVSKIESRPSFLSILGHTVSTLLWPNPKAWAGLAAVWVLIIGLHFAAQESAPMMATISTLPSAETVAAMKERQKILVELIGNNEPREADKPRRFPAQPRSELRGPTSLA